MSKLVSKGKKRFRNKMAWNRRFSSIIVLFNNRIYILWYID